MSRTEVLKEELEKINDRIKLLIKKRRQIFRELVVARNAAKQSGTHKIETRPVTADPHQNRQQPGFKPIFE
jgi:hypothetical protein